MAITAEKRTEITEDLRSTFAAIMAADLQMDELMKLEDTGDAGLNAAIAALKDSVHAARSAARLAIYIAKEG